MVASTTQSQLESHQEQLARLQSEVDALREQLRSAQRLATVGTMTAMVVHEFNNILTPIINYAQMARKNPALVEKALRRVSDGGMRATNICRALLGITRAGSVEPQTVHLAELVAKTLDAMARNPAKDAIELSLNIPANLKITTRTAELQQVLLNLLINARRAVLAVEGNRRIEISAHRNGGGTVIDVSDSGVGIPPENLQRIFEPFFSTSNSQPTGRDCPKATLDSQGYGLGLAFCRETIASLGGEISVESTPGQGSTFTIRLTD